MMKKFKWISIALIAAMLVFSLVGCENDPKPGPKPTPEPTDLALIKANGLALTDSEVEFQEELFTEEDWEDAENFKDLGEEYIGKITIYSPVQYLGVIEKLELTKNAKASIYFVRGGTAEAVPDADKFVPFDLEENEDSAYLLATYGAPAAGIPLNQQDWRMFIKVENDTSGAVNYYRFEITVTTTNANAKLDKVLIGERFCDTTILDTENEEGFVGIPTGELSLTSSTNLAGTPVTVDYNFKLTTITGTNKFKSTKFGKQTAANAATVPQLSETAPVGPFADGDVIFIEVIAGSGAKRYYKIMVTVGRTNRLTGLTVQIGTGTAVAAANLGNGGPTWSDAPEGATITPVGGKTNATIAYTKEDDVATVEVAVGPGTPEPTWGTTLTGLTLVHNEYIWAKVTVGQYIRIYKVKITFSNSTALVSTFVEEPNDVGGTSYLADGIKVQYDTTGTVKGLLGTAETVLTDSAFNSLPMPAGAGNSVGIFGVKIVHRLAPNPLKLEVNLAPASVDATVHYSFGNNSLQDVAATNWRLYNRTTATMETPSSAGYYLYVRVTAADGITVKYYVGKFEFDKEMDIQYGQPTINNAAKTIDNLWFAKNPDDTDKYEWQYIETITISTDNGENTAAYRTGYNNDLTAGGKGTGFTWGRAKLMWDEQGVYVFMVVRKHNNAVYAGSASSTEHQYDSVEVFINERVDTTGNVYVGNGTGGASGATNSSYSGRGGQYRLTPSSDLHRSGTPSLASTGFTDSTKFPSSGWEILATDAQALGDLAKHKADDDGTYVPSAAEKGMGYILIFKVPFRFGAEPWAGNGNPEAGTGTQVDPKAPWPPVNNKKIGIDIQINVSSAANVRMGCMVWKNTQATNYQNCSKWGQAVLLGKP